MHILHTESGYYLVDGLSGPQKIFSATHNGLDGIAFSPDTNAIAIVTDLGNGIQIIDLNGNILFEPLITDITYIDNLIWR